MKAILEFILPEDQEAHEMAVNAGNTMSSLWEFANVTLRNLTKYGCHPHSGRELTKEESDIVEVIVDRFYEIMNEHNVKLY